MRIRLTLACFGAFAAAFALGAPAAHAFTMEGPAVDNRYAVPEFNLEEQAKGFTKGSSGMTSNGENQFSTPLGNGTLNFGVQQGAVSNFGLGGLGFGPSAGSRAGRADFDRMVTPEGLR